MLAGLTAFVSAGLSAGAAGAYDPTCATSDPGYRRTFDVNADLGIFAPDAPGTTAGYLLFGDTVGWTGFRGGGNPFLDAPVTRKNAVIPYDACTGDLAPDLVLPELNLGLVRLGYSATIPTGAVNVHGVLYMHVMYGDVFRGSGPEPTIGGMRGHGLWKYAEDTWAFVPSWLAPMPFSDGPYGSATDSYADDDPFLQSALTLSRDGTSIWVFGANSNVLAGTITIGRVNVHDGNPDWMTGHTVGTWQVGGRVRDLSAFTDVSGDIYVMWLDDGQGTRVTRLNPATTEELGHPFVGHEAIDDLGYVGYGGSIIDLRDDVAGGHWYLITSSDAMTYTTSVHWVSSANAHVR